MGIGTLLERVLHGIVPSRGPSAAELFRRADRLRQDGRYAEAEQLVEAGLRRAPNSAAGHLMAAYLHLAAREIGPARDAFQTVLSLEPVHPRALLGLARIAIEEGDLDSARPYLARALEYHTDFPEARALEEMLSSWTGAAEIGAHAAQDTGSVEGVKLAAGGRDPILVRLDGAVLFEQCDGGRAATIAPHVAQIARIAAATLSRAGLGPLRHGAIAAAGGSTYLRSDGAQVLAVTLPAGTASADGLAEVGRLWTDKTGGATTHG